MKIIFILISTLFSFPDGPPDEYTGAPGQNSCYTCHTTYGTSIGTLEISGIPDEVQYGETYQIKVKIAHPLQNRWGFQLISVFNDSIGYYYYVPDDGAYRFKNAGSFDISENTTIQSSITNNLTYIKHTLEGTYENQPDSASWIVNWTPPDSYNGPITFYAAAVAANNQFANWGDYTYTANKTVNLSLDFDTANMDYDSDIQPIFNHFCISCHGFDGNYYNNNGLDLVDYQNPDYWGGNTGQMIRPGDPDNSILTSVLNGTSPSIYDINPMPYFGASIPENYQDRIRSWILDGAEPYSYSCTLGDVNSDESVNILDIIEVINCIFEDNCEISECIDVNNDNLITVLDIVSIIDMILEW